MPNKNKNTPHPIPWFIIQTKRAAKHAILYCNPSSLLSSPPPPRTPPRLSLSLRPDSFLVCYIYPRKQKYPTSFENNSPQATRLNQESETDPLLRPCPLLSDHLPLHPPPPSPMGDSDRRGGGGGGRGGDGGDLAVATVLAGGGSCATASRSIPVMLGRATSRRLMRAPSSSSTAAAAMRETAALQLEERHYDWGYSKPVVALDLVWNLAFVLVSVSVLLSTARERPSTPIRAWICGYAVQCLLHVGFVCFEYQRRRRWRSWRRIRWDGAAEEEDGLENTPESRFCY